MDQLYPYKITLTMYCTDADIVEQCANTLDSAIRKSNIPFDMEVDGPDIAGEEYTFRPPILELDDDEEAD